MDVSIGGAGLSLQGQLLIPPGCRGIVLFAHGSGSSRSSPRNTWVAGFLNRAGLGTLLFDLLTEGEEKNSINVFDTPFLAGRLKLATRWLLTDRKEARNLPLGYFGASTGAAAALWAAADLGHEIAAIVSRGGRPDLAVPRIGEVLAPTLLIVGENDRAVISLNEEALGSLKIGELKIIPGATHLFEEPGALDSVARLAQDWFLSRMS
jgi:putative phosphoribosyl transferase